VVGVYIALALAVLAVTALDYTVKRRHKYWQKQLDAAHEYLRRLRYLGPNACTSTFMYSLNSGLGSSNLLVNPVIGLTQALIQ
jgi:hypothetical protein